MSIRTNKRLSINTLAVSGTKDADSIASNKRLDEKGRVPRSGVKRITRKFARERFEACSGNQFTESARPGEPPTQGWDVRRGSAPDVCAVGLPNIAPT